MKAQTNPATAFVVVRGAIPSELSIGKIYVNLAGNRAHHLCACGCGSRVMTPLNSHEWRLIGSDLRPSLTPSVGNWNLECQSHYWIRKGQIIWSARWSADEIAAGRVKEQKPYFEDALQEKKKSLSSYLAELLSRDRK